jgi:transposase
MDQLDKCIKALLPKASCLQVQQLEVTEEELLLTVSSTQPAGRCPVCGTLATRVQSHYQRTLQDLPWSGLCVRLRLHVRRFFCANTACSRHIFTERLPTLTEPYARRTKRLREALLALGRALGGQAGARQSRRLAMPVCGATLLSLLRRYEDSSPPTPRVLGVDDWGFQRKHPTGTILVDLEQHRPVDLLLGSDDQVLSQWLRAHPGVEVISRDRGASYQKGATQGAPHAQHVLDRWHLLKNLGDVLQKTLAGQIEVLRQAGQEVKQTSQQTPSLSAGSPQARSKLRKPPRRKPPALSPRRAWQVATYQQVHEQAADGQSPTEIATRLHINRHTVSKYLRMPTFVTHYRGPRGSPVEPYRAYLQARWEQGEVMIKTLWQELQEQGFTGSYKSVWNFVRTWPLPVGMTPTSSAVSTAALAASTSGSAPATRTPRQAMWLLLHHQEELGETDAAYRQALLSLDPRLWTLAALGQEFVHLIRERQSAALLPWLEKAKTCAYEEVRRFALGLSNEFAATQAALTEPWSPGQVEGQITKLKLLKRQMYGRANIDLLRLRLLHAA